MANKRVKVQGYPGVYKMVSERREFNGKPDESYYITYSIGSKKKWERVGWRSEGYSPASASQVRAMRIQAINHGEELPQARASLTVQDVWEEYYTAGEAKGIKSYGGYRRQYELHIQPAFGTTAIKAITASDLMSFQAKLLKGMSPGTVHGVMRLFKAIVTRAYKRGVIRGLNPFEDDDFEPPRFNNERTRFLTEAEAHELLSYLKEKDEALWLISLISLNTGMRFNEIANMRWKAINLKDASVRVKRKHPKKVVYQTIYLNDVIVNELVKLTANPRHPNDLLFPNRNGGVRQGSGEKFSRAVEMCGLNDGIESDLDKAVFHTLRHTFASWLAQRGETLQTIMELMGHQKVEMTLRYAKLMPDQSRDAVHRIGSIFTSPQYGKLQAVK